MLEIVVALLLVVLLTALALYEHERQPGETGAMRAGRRSGGDRGVALQLWVTCATWQRLYGYGCISLVGYILWMATRFTTVLSRSAPPLDAS